ncbi:MAG: alpha-D-ribose 1-methylphosphonate 5-triphosphate diphosphatase [Pseudomonadota bacterium]
MTLKITGARIVLQDDVVETDLRIEDGMIEAIGTSAPAAHQIDGSGLILAPALIDIHGDAFERQIMPRPGVFFPMEAALLDTDRQLAANGIATAYHALTLSWEPGLRSVDRGRAMVEGLDALQGRLTVENRIQLRWETFAFEAFGLMSDVLNGPLTPSIAFNDHTSMSMRAFDVPVQQRAFEQSPDFSIAALDDERLKTRTESSAKRAGMSNDDYIAKLAEIWDRRAQVDGAIRQVAALGRETGASMLSHDDTRIETRNYYRDLGASIAEFPMTTEVANEARANGDHIVFGAPNVVRGGSHIGSPSAAEMVAQGLCDVLASDYFYPSMLAAVARLHDERRAPLPQLWGLVSSGPARASGLTDRGDIAPGKRADLVLVDWPEGATPAVKMTLSAGQIAYQADRRALVAA